MKRMRISRLALGALGAAAVAAVCQGVGAVVDIDDRFADAGRDGAGSGEDASGVVDTGAADSALDQAAPPMFSPDGGPLLLETTTTNNALGRRGHRSPASAPERGCRLWRRHPLRRRRFDPARRPARRRHVVKAVWCDLGNSDITTAVYTFPPP